MYCRPIIRNSVGVQSWIFTLLLLYVSPAAPTMMPHNLFGGFGMFTSLWRKEASHYWWYFWWWLLKISDVTLGCIWSVSASLTKVDANLSLQWHHPYFLRHFLSNGIARKCHEVQYNTKYTKWQQHRESMWILQLLLHLFDLNAFMGNLSCLFRIETSWFRGESTEPVLAISTRHHIHMASLKSNLPVFTQE